MLIAMMYSLLLFFCVVWLVNSMCFCMHNEVKKTNLLNRAVYFPRWYFLKTTSKWRALLGTSNTLPAGNVRHCWLANPSSWMQPTCSVQPVAKTDLPKCLIWIPKSVFWLKPDLIKLDKNVKEGVLGEEGHYIFLLKLLWMFSSK